MNGYQELQSDLAGSRRRRLEALERIVKLYETWGKPDKAAEWRAKRVPPLKPAEKGTEVRKERKEK